MEIADNEIYAEALTVHASAGQAVELRAGDGAPADRALGGAHHHGRRRRGVTLNGLVLDGGGVHVPAAGNRLETLRSAPLHDRRRRRTGAHDRPARLHRGDRVPQSWAASGAVEDAVVQVSDAHRRRGIRGRGSAVRAAGRRAGRRAARAQLTLIGRVHTRILRSATNAIFLARPGPLRSASGRRYGPERLQEGGVRFSYVPPGSRVPRRYNCQPAGEAIDDRVRPVARLAPSPATPTTASSASAARSRIREGADDGAEMGAFHDSSSRSAWASLAARLERHLRFGLEAGIFFAS